MQRFFYLISFTSVLLFLTALGCAAYSLPGEPSKGNIPKTITFLISSDTTANFTPCGCHSGKWGGIPRRGTIFQNTVKKLNWPAILVDTGDIASGSIPNEKETNKLKYILQGYQVMGYDVINFGFKDATVGNEFLDFVKEYNLPVISANTYPAGVFTHKSPVQNVGNQNQENINNPPTSGSEEDIKINQPPASDTILPSYKVVELKEHPGFLVGIFGVMIQDEGRLSLVSDFSFAPYATAIKQTVDTLRNKEKVNLVVCISDVDGTEKFTDDLKEGIDIIIAGMQRPQRSENSVYNPNNPLFNQQNLNELLKSQAKESGKTPDENQTPDLNPLETPLIFPKGAGQAKKVTRLDISFNPQGQIIDYYFEEMVLDENVEDDPRMAEVAYGYDKDVHSDDLYNRIAYRFAGSQSCEECHVGFTKAWQDHGHFKAYETIAKSNSLEERSCVKCHAAGYDEEARLIPYTMVPEKLQVIGCEGCHPNGQSHINHIQNMERFSPETQESMNVSDPLDTVNITEALCVKCHTGKWAENFDYQKAFEEARIICTTVKK